MGKSSPMVKEKSVSPRQHMGQLGTQAYFPCPKPSWLGASWCHPTGNVRAQLPCAPTSPPGVLASIITGSSL